MKTYRIKASYMTYLTAEIQAESQEEAERIAHDMDGGEFTDDGSMDWNIDSVDEVKP
jgi:hypothetical protein